MWQDKDYRDNQVELRNKEDFKKATSERAKKLWQDPVYRSNIIKVLDKARLSSISNNHISGLQITLYSILDDLGVQYYKEGPKTIVGPIVTKNGRFDGYSFDCLVTHKDKKLYIECNGEYWHKDKSAKDIAKSTFLHNYVPESELLVLWEFEFRSIDRIRKILTQKLGIEKTPIQSFSFNEVQIIPVIEVNEEFRNLLSKYHYLANIGRYGSYRYAAILNNKIIAAAVYSTLTRKESAARHNLLPKEMLELSRFCIHPEYQMKNFASWFLSRSLKLIPKGKIKRIITFADTTFGHVGTIYKATNWVYDGETDPDYWYIDKLGCRYHKKTIWDQACKFNKSEMEYASSIGLIRMMGKKKIRYYIDN